MSEMKLVKQWHLSWFDTQDLEYISDLGCDYEVNDTVKTRDVTAPNGQVYRYVVDRDLPYGIYIFTENSKQESLIQLKYSENITLMKMWYVNEWTRYELQPDI